MQRPAVRPLPLLGATIATMPRRDDLKSILIIGSGPIVIHLESDPLIDAPSSESWWDVPVSAVAELDSTKKAYQVYEDWKAVQKPLLG